MKLILVGKVDGNSTYGTDLSVSSASTESEKIILSKLSTKSIEIKKFQTALITFSERNKNVDSFESQLVIARSDYNKILNFLNIIRIRTNSMEGTDSTKHKSVEENNQSDLAQGEVSVHNISKDKIDYTKNITEVYSSNNLDNQNVVDKVIY